jgi:hypothetical protein
MADGITISRSNIIKTHKVSLSEELHERGN